MLGMVNTLVHKVGLIPDSAVCLAQDLGTPGLETEATLSIAGEANTLEAHQLVNKPAINSGEQ
jgi:hypothetical protein